MYSITGLLLAVLVPLVGGQGGRIYIIALGHDYGPQEYVDGRGYLTGFIHDMVPAVCEAAGVDCRTVYDKSSNCWASSRGGRASGGKGVYQRWYDGCSGFDATIERIHTFQFSMPYSKILKSYFYYRKDTSFDPSDLTDKKIGFANGYASNEKCIARQDSLKNHVLKNNQIFYYETTEDFLDAIRNKTIDAAFADSFTFPAEMVRAHLSYDGQRPVTCILAGNSIMSRVDSDLPSVWNIGFSKLRNSQRYKEICQEGDRKHGHRGSVDCLEN